jgi:hypothetical protein
MTPAEAELEVLVPRIRHVLLGGGVAVAVYPLSWEKELAYRRELSTEVRKIDGDGMTGIARIIAGCSDTTITALVCDLTHENRAFVEEHFTFDTVLEVVSPFIAEVMGKSLEVDNLEDSLPEPLQGKTKDDDYQIAPSPYTISTVIDTLANEYGWTAEHILSMTRAQVMLFASVIGDRYSRQSEASEAYRKKSEKGGTHKGTKDPSVEQLQSAFGSAVHVD